jgi:prevent-host-death family protein
MQKINIYDAKAHFSRIIQEVAQTGESIVIAKNGRAMVKVSAYVEEKIKRKLGFLKGKGTIPDDFDNINREEIGAMFAGKYD